MRRKAGVCPALRSGVRAAMATKRENEMKFLGFPTWAIVILIIKLDLVPIDHKWRQDQFFTLSDWTASRTELCKLLDAILWFHFSCLALVIVIGILYL
jgi:hypothetical protein